MWLAGLPSCVHLKVIIQINKLITILNCINDEIVAVSVQITHTPRWTHSLLRHQSEREPIENDLLVGIILSNLTHNTRQTLYAHVTRGDAHTHTHTNAGRGKWRRCIHHIRCRHFFRYKEISLIYVQHSLPVCVCASVWAHVVHASCTLYYTH